MNKVLGVLIALLISGNVFSQGIEFEHGTFNEALAKAKKENKLVFMDCYTSWCGPCKLLSKNIFPQKEVGDFFNKNFVSIKMDCEKGEGPAVAGKYGVKAFPTMLFIDAKGNAVHKIVGYKDAKGLIENAAGALDPSKRIGAFHKKYDEGNRDEAFVLNYMDVLNAAYEKVKLRDVAREFLATKPIADFINKDLFKVIDFAMLQYGSPEINYVLEHKADVKAFLAEDKYTFFERGIYEGHLYTYAKECSGLDDLYKEFDRIAKEYKMDMMANFKEILTLGYYESHKQADKWFDLAVERADKFFAQGMGGTTYLNTIDQIIREPNLHKSEGIYEKAIALMNEVNQKEGGKVAAQFSLAKLYLAMGKKELAKKHFANFSKMDKGPSKQYYDVVSKNVKKAVEAL